MRNHKKTAILVMCQSRSKKKDVINVYRPNTGLQTKQDTLEDVKKKYKKVTSHVFSSVQILLRHQHQLAVWSAGKCEWISRDLFKLFWPRVLGPPLWVTEPRFFPRGFMACALRWKNSVRNFQYGPQTRLLKGIYCLPHDKVTFNVNRDVWLPSTSLHAIEGKNGSMQLKPCDPHQKWFLLETIDDNSSTSK